MSRRHIQRIPENCHERFVDFPLQPDSAEWFGNGVSFACISELYAGYYIHRPDCGHHLLIYTTCGEGAFCTEELSGSLGGGDMLFIPAGKLHHYETAQSWNFIAMHFNPASVRWKYLKDYPALLRPSRYRGEVAALLEMMLSESRRPDSQSSRVVHYYCRLILAYVDMELRHSSSVADIDCERRLEKVWEQVGGKLERKWTVEDMAVLAGMSPPHFYSVTRKLYSRTPMEIVRNLRIARAAQLLRFSSESLEQIAEKTGYESPFAFSRAFKRIYSQSPGLYRRGIQL